MIVPPSFLFQYQLSVPRIDGLPQEKGAIAATAGCGTDLRASQL